MSFLNNLWGTLKEDLKAIPPESVKIFKNEETGEFAYEIKNKPNKYVPTTVRHYSNGKIFLFDASNNSSEGSNIFTQLLKGKGDEKKCLEVKKD